ncbi:rhomboid family intramembrane serine protease [Ancylomarina euxinus]|uniref:Rhomboid family intramembrane serine protease n=1 Tax=Ancylomarina euxinus TaxID=2283627 RepID=A0A425Y820_9BACT|nr:rhomboid family intramembrane serine protease [Ancylomarina euxinus]MCZ4693502.1 rhomboid family intramembrane serine protease [Ancylomarina euxinus]MUP13729.1 rhomboid family intramembrane serine protease [Ancylomarina euxinus]RRG24633.1 rhomboid family intramembrane serine protease [Ancylomarina euxinus]
MSNFKSSLLNLPPVVKNLLIINALMLLGTWVLQQTGVDLSKILGLHFFASEYFMPFQFVTHMFMHANITHLFFNMFALFMFGRVLESVWGPKRFLLYYMLTGLGAAALHTFVLWLDYASVMKAFTAFSNTPTPELFSAIIKDSLGRPPSWVYEFADKWADNPDSIAYANQGIEIARRAITESINVTTVGASGAVFGILLAFGMLFPNTELMLLFLPIPIKAKYFVMGYGAIELYSGFMYSSDGVAHFAHLGGMLFGFILIKYWNKHSNRFY